MPDVTVREMRIVHQGNPVMNAVFDWSISVATGLHTYEKFCECVETVVVHSIGQMILNPKECAGRSEDSLSLEIIKSLRTVSFSAEFDATNGGHCDIAAKFGTAYSWIGEAKKYTGPKKLLKGYLQLTTRYSTGQENDSRGAMIVYFFVPDTADKMLQWKDYLVAQHSSKSRRQVSSHPMTNPANSFRTMQAHKRTGLPYEVKHFSVPLHFDPEDRGL